MNKMKFKNISGSLEEDLIIIHDDEDDLIPTNNLNLQIISCVLLEMALSFLGILTNLLGKLKR